MIDSVNSYLGKPASVLLSSEPFSLWKFKRSIEEAPLDTVIDYIFEKHGLSLVCDRDDIINSIFMEADTFDQSLLDIPFSSSRRDILKLIGIPSRSGEARTHSVLGEHGAWDRFDGERYSVHIEYQPHADRIKMVTLMRSDVAP